MRVSTIFIPMLLALSLSWIANAADKTERTWQAQCAVCHGDDGKGQTVKGRQMGVKDFSTASWQKGVTNDEIQLTISDGTQRPKSGLTGAKITTSITDSSQNPKSSKMEGFRNQLKPDQIADLVLYCRTLAK